VDEAGDGTAWPQAQREQDLCEGWTPGEFQLSGLHVRSDDLAEERRTIFGSVSEPEGGETASRASEGVALSRQPDTVAESVSEIESTADWLGELFQLRELFEGISTYGSLR